MSDRRFPSGPNRYLLLCSLALVLGAIAPRASASVHGARGDRLFQSGLAPFDRGEFEAAPTTFQPILQVRGDRPSPEAIAPQLANLGSIDDVLNRLSPALNTYRRTLERARAIGDWSEVAQTLDRLGDLYVEFKQYDRALESFQEALKLFQRLGDLHAIARVQNQIGKLYFSAGDYLQSLDFLQQSLATFQRLGDLAGESIALGNIARVLDRQNKTELAIIFYKKAINLTEDLRQTFRETAEGFPPLPLELKEIYTGKVEDTYKQLSELLLQSDRVVEAQEVLDLLKIQEIDSYLRSVRGSDLDPRRLQLLPQEEQLVAEYTRLQTEAVELGKESSRLQAIPPEERTATQQERLDTLGQLQQQLGDKFQAFVNRPDVVEIERQLRRSSPEDSLKLASLQQLQGRLQGLDRPVAILYPLVLEDRLELVLVTPDGPPLHRTVAVSREELNGEIVEFRKLLTDPKRRRHREWVQESGYRLYQWLLAPIEAALARGGVETILYAPDGQLRYIPLGALYDGDRWAIERFEIDNITAIGLTQFEQPKAVEGGGRSPHRVLAGAFSEGTYRIWVGDREFIFSGLPFAGAEVDNVASAIPMTTTLFNDRFSPEATIARAEDYTILHLATHAAFVTGEPEESFILFGNGDRVTLRDVALWSLPNVELVVLSACQTGVGGVLGNGQEILGFGYQMQQTGAEATISSLWSVDDRGTQLLMDAFYEQLQTPGVGKGQALRQAQLSLLADPQYSHPYHWASFILIGNGLD
ncbi:CHAT domain-containing protein [Oxynema sp. CENA135]|uniref:CHAT domain-containing protein n=1 Tax=Oxynema sp. CENA135 TaxID=984206 RepID=UPI00190A5B72|nr:CHAT domain-containing protein [Oxynema sp. CENA135]MBK4730337.1 CHAT domain-containing protein [Oxynema sp. CENA135]